MLACAGYMVLTIISINVIPLIFHQMKWYFVVVVYLLSPILGLCNAYGFGLTDMKCENVDLESKLV